jgi:hypothetical protein
MPHPEKILTREHLAALDEARDYDAASSYNYLNAELWKLRAALHSGGAVRIEEENGSVIFSSDEDFVSWVRHRYPFSELALSVR